MNSARPFVNSAILIQEIKKRPCLYENPGARANAEGRLAAWGEIGPVLFKTWNQLGPTDKDVIVREMQTKWKSLRDNYSRQIRIQEQVKAGLIPDTGKRYIYMDQLQFLEKYVQRKEKHQSQSDDNSKSSTDTDSNQNTNDPPKSSVPLQNDATAITLSSYVPIQPKPSINSLKRVAPISNVNHIITTEPVNESSCSTSNSSLIEPPLKKVAKALEDFVNLQKDELSDDPLGNRKFLHSLLPFMKRLPDDVNLEVRLQLMSVLQSYSGGRYSSSNDK